MLGLIDAFIDRLAQVLENTSDEIDQISHEVFRSRSRGDKREPQDLQSVIERIGRKGELLTMARESLLSILRLTSFHQAGGEGKKATAALRQEAKTLQRDATALADHAAYLSNKVNFLLDATLGLINLEQNQIIKIFTVAVCRLPAADAGRLDLRHELRRDARAEMDVRLSAGDHDHGRLGHLAVRLFQAAPLALIRTSGLRSRPGNHKARQWRALAFSSAASISRRCAGSRVRPRSS